MTNDNFLKALESSFEKFLEVGINGKNPSRSTAKLKPLHGFVANDLHVRMGAEYEIVSQGYDEDREIEISGRYINKKVDITIVNNERPVCGVAVKFVMQNYAQNSNNYFENMLGETANIRSNQIPYFQIFVITKSRPYFKKDKSFNGWEELSIDQLHKYCVLDKDDPDRYQHTPNKMLVYVLDLPKFEFSDCSEYYTKYSEYLSECRRGGRPVFTPVNMECDFSNSIIFNDYETFAQKVFHTIKAL